MEAAEARFTDLYEAHYRHVLAFLLRRTGCTSTAQDLTEEVFLVAWRKLDAVPDGDEAAYWLYGVARKTLSADDRPAADRTALAHSADRPRSAPRRRRDPTRRGSDLRTGSEPAPGTRP